MASEAVSPDDLDPEAELTELEFSIFGYVSRPRAEVYEAVADPLVLSKYFTTGGAEGRDLRARVAAQPSRGAGSFRQLHGLDGHARCDESLARVRHQPARGFLPLAFSDQAPLATARSVLISREIKVSCGISGNSRGPMVSLIRRLLACIKDEPSASTGWLVFGGSSL